MKADLPQISIVTPSYNQGQFIERTILSVLSQGYPNLEYFVIDGGSTDGSLEIIKNYHQQITYWESVPDRGQAHAINKGWRRAAGDIIAWINSDDYYLPGAFEKIASAYQKNPNAIGFIGICEFADAEGNIIGKGSKPIPFDLESILSGGDIPGQPSVFLSRKVLNTIGYLNENFHYIMDWEYWLRMAEKYPPEQYKKIDKPLAVFNTWEGGKTQSGIVKDLIERRDFFDVFYEKEENKKLIKIRNFSYGSTFWREGRKYMEHKKYINASYSYLRAFLFHPFEYNFFKAIFLNLDLILPIRVQGYIKQALDKDK